ncbi:BLUF domain-containing protein [Erythrobacter rubeus]|uniref:BLUF domain-containing protein n=1 Tax=Erythrobacter rubeus TaxID=2760803 RepID=A0ABR8KUD7_9SPHN|nr:BLUF domain-containing protein [Erythrobacter rubeus]MBD2843210.1 BLUF domain-containing protein [Erythrobacter rubeus]
MISQYLYISTAPSLSRDEVDSILASSARNNPANGITGLLIYNGRNFLQLLEGDEAELISLMVRITHDPRHTGISILEKNRVEQRSCPDWAMKRVLIAEGPEKRRELLEAELPETLDPGLRKVIMNFAVLN